MKNWDTEYDLRELALSVIPVAWPGLSDDLRNDVIDTLSTYDHVLALKCLAGSTSLDFESAEKITAALAKFDRSSSLAAS